MSNTQSSIIPLHRAFIFVTEAEGYLKFTKNPIPHKNELRILIDSARREADAAFQQKSRAQLDFSFKELTCFVVLVRFFINLNSLPSGDESFMRMWRLAVNFSEEI